MPDTVGLMKASTFLVDKKLYSTPVKFVPVSVPEDQSNAPQTVFKKTVYDFAFHTETSVAGVPVPRTTNPQDRVTTQRNPSARKLDMCKPSSEICLSQPPWQRCVVISQSTVGDDHTLHDYFPVQDTTRSEIPITTVTDTTKVLDNAASQGELSRRE